MGLVHGAYDAKAERLHARRREPAQLHGAARPRRGGLRESQRTPTSQPHKLDNTLAFMFESRYRFASHRVRAERAAALDNDYADCWAGLQDKFKP